VRVALYTPTPKGWVSQRAADTTLADAAWLLDGGHEYVNMAQHVCPGNSIEVGRNTAIQRAWNLDCTHIRMLDADVSRPWGEPLISHLFAAAEHCGAAVSAAAVEVHGGRKGKSNIWPASDEPYWEARQATAAAMLIDLHVLMDLDWPKRTPYFLREYNSYMTHCVTDEGYFFTSILHDMGVIVAACNVTTRHSHEIV